MPSEVPYRKEDDLNWVALKFIGLCPVVAFAGIQSVVALTWLDLHTLAVVWACCLVVGSVLTAVREIKRPHDDRLTAFGVPKWSLLRPGDAATFGLWLSGVVGLCVVLFTGTSQFWLALIICCVVTPAGLASYWHARLRRNASS